MNFDFKFIVFDFRINNNNNKEYNDFIIFL